VIGGGVAIAGSPASRFIHAIKPRDSARDPDHTPENGWSSTVFKDGGSKRNVKAFAICNR